jgi:hypothetical protein
VRGKNSNSKELGELKRGLLDIYSSWWKARKTINTFRYYERKNSNYPVFNSLWIPKQFDYGSEFTK